VGLQSKTVVVTGGSRGIGAEIATQFLKGGSRVVVVARNKEILKAQSDNWKASGLQGEYACCDVSDESSVIEMAEEIISSWGGVDILVNNAGVGHSSPIKKESLSDWNRVFSINATSAFLCTRAFLPQMLDRGWGRVINMASIAGKTGGRYIGAYAASKHALIGLTRCVAAEVMGTGVTANAVCPGYVDTDMTLQTLETISSRTGFDENRAMDALLQSCGQARLITPAEVAHVTLSLCEENSGGVNGQSIVIDGGVVFI
jgi:NAD(P)-dependent dehydrogenase (short-subunit alcohol dehydrogenase family)